MDTNSAVELAQQLFRDHRPACFWNCDPDMVITRDDISFIINRLRKGSRETFMAAAALQKLSVSTCR